MNLRPYQQEAVEAITRGFAEYDKQLAVLPTGSGKTIIFAKLSEHYQPRKTLVLAHREELIAQAVDKIERATGLVAEVEMGECNASHDSPVVVASVQTLCRKQRREKWNPDHFGLVVVDESHHLISDSYQSVLSHFDRNSFVLGVTATPDRGDKKSLARYFQNIACEVSLLDLVKQGYLSPIRVKTVPLGLDLRSVRTTAGDYNAGDLGHAIQPYLAQIADVIARDYRERKTLVFLPLISMSQEFARLCRERGIAAEHVDGQSKERGQTLDRFARNQTRLITNAMLLTEGYDEPSIDCVVCLRPTKIRSLYSQIVGRGTRIHPGKDHLLLLDFLWLSHEHNLVRPAHLIAESDEEAERITAKIGEDGDLEEAKESVEADRTAKLRKRLEQNTQRRGGTFDALELALTINDLSLAEFVPTMEWHGDPVTPKQAQVLAKFGMDAETVTCKGQACRILDRVFMRSRMGLATPKQVRQLKRFGYEQPELASFEEASAFLEMRLGARKAGVA